jgi:hypothetical protein
VLPKDGPTADRHLGLWCGCPLLECCHNEDQFEHRGRHIDLGSPRSGYLLPWTDDEYAEDQRAGLV